MKYKVITSDTDSEIIEADGFKVEGNFIVFFKDYENVAVFTESNFVEAIKEA